MERTRAWLHFIGAKYYSIKEFVKESQEKGISRAVAPAVLRKMKIGDLVVLAQKDGRNTVIFGTFIISRIIGLTEGVIRDLHEKGICREYDYDSPQTVERGCGSYVIAGVSDIVDAGKMMDVISGLSDEEIGRTMVGGYLEYFRKPLVINNTPFRQGFRRFDWDKFSEALSEKRKLKPDAIRVRVDGHFYVFDFPGDEKPKETSLFVADPTLLVIKDYQLN